MNIRLKELSSISYHLFYELLASKIRTLRIFLG